MPFCEACAKYWTPNSMNEDGTCPQCGELVEEPHVHDDEDDGRREDAVALQAARGDARRLPQLAVLADLHLSPLTADQVSLRASALERARRLPSCMAATRATGI